MPNQYKNKVVYGGTTLIDITDTTATASDVALGKKFYAASGQPLPGTAESEQIVQQDVANSTGITCQITGGMADPFEMLVKANNKTITSFSASDFPVTEVRDYMFHNCAGITDFDFSNITYVGMLGFYGCSFVNLVFPKRINVKSNAFRANSTLKTVVAKKGTMDFDNSCFESCTALEVLDVAEYWGQAMRPLAFYNTPNIQALILRMPSFRSLQGAFYSNSSLSSSAIIYVPESLLNDYKTASNWSAYESRIQKIEGTTYETHWGDGTLIT